jgi:predicted nucleotidyltransferase
MKEKIDREAIALLCRKHGIRKLSLFGSVLGGDFGPASDVDVLVEFKPGAVTGFRIIDIEDELSRILGGRRVDLVSEKYLNRHLRDRVIESAEVIYVEG